MSTDIDAMPFWRRPGFEDRWRAEYHPCENGVHIFQPEGGEYGGLTVENFPGVDLTLFREHSSAGDDDDFDLLADLFIEGELIDNVAIRRQDLEVIRRALAKGGE